MTKDHALFTLLFIIIILILTAIAQDVQYIREVMDHVRFQ